jgi:hypothetical protein
LESIIVLRMTRTSLREVAWRIVGLSFDEPLGQIVRQRELRLTGVSSVSSSDIG